MELISFIARIISQWSRSLRIRIITLVSKSKGKKLFGFKMQRSDNRRALSWYLFRAIAIRMGTGIRKQLKIDHLWNKEFTMSYLVVFLTER